MKQFKEFAAEKEKDKINFDLEDKSESGTVTEEENLDEFFSTAASRLNDKHERLANKIDNDKSHNFISRAIAHGNLNDKMRSQHDTIAKNNPVNKTISKVKNYVKKSITSNTPQYKPSRPAPARYKAPKRINANSTRPLKSTISR